MTDGTLHLVAQLLGFVSFLFGILCFYQKNDRKLKWMMLCMNANNIVHFAMLGSPTSSISAALGMCRTWLSLHTSSKRIAFCFIAVSMSIGVYFSNEWVDMFPVIATSIGTYALFCLEGVKMRIAFLFGAASWLINNILVGSFGTALLEMVLIIVNLNTIRRLYFAPKEDEA